MRACRASRAESRRVGSPTPSAATWSLCVAERANARCRYRLVTPTRSCNPFVVEPKHRASLACDIATARDVWVAMRFAMPPPGWRPGNQRETTEELRRSFVAARTQA
ncbi:hypothetical protein L2Y90_18245 [Burkholderia pyrrocinia]|uniref:hypothetical protein n=1 Tax=Burkholderia pyrrocinia TaxID=60550 RepID=UPI00215A756E|nr:hypothetical protein [Burkholderia pyrrocinia]UVE68714.1 hypothetical protein L2Y90_18245 [Burkholderia pyrrocinia]